MAVGGTSKTRLRPLRFAFFKNEIERSPEFERKRNTHTSGDVCGVCKSMREREKEAE